MLTVQEIRALSNLHPDYAPIHEAGHLEGLAWTLETDIRMLRGFSSRALQAVPKLDSSSLSHTEEDFQIFVRDGAQITVRLYKPRQPPADGCPGMVVFHGGGFIVGDIDIEAQLSSTFAALGGIVISVDYRLAPEFPFPTAIYDAFDVTNWTAQNAENLGINPSKGFLVGGTSAGADISLVVSHLCRDSQMSPPLTGIYASIPTGVDASSTPSEYKDRFLSMEQNADSPIFSADSVAFFRKLYAPEPGSPLAFPVAFPDHSGLPKTYFQACGLDPLRDCALVTEQVWKDAGVPTRLDLYPGVPHGFWYVLPQLKVSQQQAEDTKEGLKWLLSK